MATILSMKELEARKRALVAESEVYREMLKLELLNLQVYRERLQRKFATYAALKPLLFLGMPFIGPLFGRRRRSRGGLFANALAAYRLYHVFAPLVRRLIIKSYGGSWPKPLPQKEEGAPAANI